MSRPCNYIIAMITWLHCNLSNEDGIRHLVLGSMKEQKVSEFIREKEEFIQRVSLSQLKPCSEKGEI